ncbi:MAG: arabinan endo,5-alpha-L-arabinosidase [Chitinophagaceae bacterium]|nr:arabinan endo,5-alpha-L-arabinosidase [Chitinophagaceae bacterium]
MLVAIIFTNSLYAQKKAVIEKTGNPVFPGWYANPEGIIFDKTYWTYPTYSASYDKQVFLDAFSSPDLTHLPTKCPAGAWMARCWILDPKIATGAGHHSVIKIPKQDPWYIVYHRRPLSETNGNSREPCIEKMYFDEQGFIKPVILTKEAVEKNVIK